MCFQGSRLLIATVLIALGGFIATVSAVAATRTSSHKPRVTNGTHSKRFMTAEAVGRRVPVLFVADAASNSVLLFNADTLPSAPIGKMTDGINQQRMGPWPP